MVDGRCKFGLTKMNVIAYADDVVLISDNVDSLEDMFKYFKKSIEYLNLKLNYTKKKMYKF